MRYFTTLLLSMSMTAAFAQSRQEILESLSGEWQLIAANNGVEIAPGVYSAGVDTIRFTATPASDGISLDCHTDKFYWRSGTDYPASWRILVEENGEGEHRLGWVLSEEQPVSEKEFVESQEKYLESGFFYWGGTEGGHRYIYLLAENYDASAIIGMTFWSQWSKGDATSYSLSNAEHQSRKVYAVVAESIPYANRVGWIEIWSSPKIERVSSTPDGIREISPDKNSSSRFCYDLQGRRYTSPPARGIYIQNGTLKIEH